MAGYEELHDEGSDWALTFMLAKNFMNISPRDPKMQGQRQHPLHRLTQLLAYPISDEGRGHLFRAKSFNFLKHQVHFMDELDVQDGTFARFSNVLNHSVNAGFVACLSLILTHDECDPTSTNEMGSVILFLRCLSGAERVF